MATSQTSAIPSRHFALSTLAASSLVEALWNERRALRPIILGIDQRYERALRVRTQSEEERKVRLVGSRVG
jgi:hypothetical protein